MDIIEFCIGAVVALFFVGLVIEGTKRVVFFLVGKRK